MIKNQYNVSGNLTINNDNSNKSRKKQRTSPDDENQWVKFLTDSEANKNLHKYSPERHGVVRVAPQLRERAKIQDISASLKLFVEALMDPSSSLEDNIEAAYNYRGKQNECRFIKKVAAAIVNMNRMAPSMSHSEATFNAKLLFPCLEATTIFIDSNTDVKPEFVPGEEVLIAMNELALNGRTLDKRKQYKADGVVRLANMFYLEVLILETAGAYRVKDERKISFDNVKGMFALLGMMKMVADQFSMASVETFKALKLYYLQASDEFLRLWSIQYASNGVYTFVREDKIKIEEETAMVPVVADFFFGIKVALMKSIDVLKQLQAEDVEQQDADSQHTRLSDIICPQVFRLTYNIHGKGFGNNPITSSPPQDD